MTLEWLVDKLFYTISLSSFSDITLRFLGVLTLFLLTLPLGLILAKKFFKGVNNFWVAVPVAHALGFACLVVVFNFVAAVGLLNRIVILFFALLFLVCFLRVRKSLSFSFKFDFYTVIIYGIVFSLFLYPALLSPTVIRGDAIHHATYTSLITLRHEITFDSSMHFMGALYPLGLHTFSSALAQLVGLPSSDAITIVSAMNLAFIFLLVFSFVTLLSNNSKAGFLASSLIFLIPGARTPSFLFKVLTLRHINFISIVSTSTYQSLTPFFNGSFTVISGTLLLVLSLFFCSKVNKQRRGALFLGGVIIAAITLSYIPFTPIVILIFLPLWLFGRFSLKQLVIIALLGFILSSNYSVPMLVKNSSLLTPAILKRASSGYTLENLAKRRGETAGYGINLFVNESLRLLGPAFFVSLIFAFWFLFRRKYVVSSSFFLGICLLFPARYLSKYLERIVYSLMVWTSTYRILPITQIFSNIILVAGLFVLVKREKFRTLIVLGVFTLFVTASLTAHFLWMFNSPVSTIQIPLSDLKSINWASENVPPNDFILVDHFTPYVYYAHYLQIRSIKNATFIYHWGSSLPLDGFAGTCTFEQKVPNHPYGLATRSKSTDCSVMINNISNHTLFKQTVDKYDVKYFLVSSLNERMFHELSMSPYVSPVFNVNNSVVYKVI